MEKKSWVKNVVDVFRSLWIGKYFFSLHEVFLSLYILFFTDTYVLTGKDIFCLCIQIYTCKPLLHTHTHTQIFGMLLCVSKYTYMYVHVYYMDVLNLFTQKEWQYQLNNVLKPSDEFNRHIHMSCLLNIHKTILRKEFINTGTIKSYLDTDNRRKVSLEVFKRRWNW